MTIKTGWERRFKKSSAKLRDSDLLKHVITTCVPAIAIFRAKDHFMSGWNKYIGVAIGWIGDNFRKAFLDGDGKVETGVTETNLQVLRLRKSSTDGPIIAELGGKKVAVISLAHLYEMIRRQGRGQQGALHTHDLNVFYIGDADGALWAVYCGWCPCYGWHVEAFPVASGRHVWDTGTRVFSR